MTLTAARRVADAVLYEGYLLYPYHASSPKNQVRWQFGVLGPEGACEAGVGEEPAIAAEVLLEAQPLSSVDVHLRFLQVQQRAVERRTDDGWTPVDELAVAGTRWVPFAEAVPREVTLAGLRVGEPHARDVGADAGSEVEELRDGGRVVGRLVRSRRALHATVSVTARPARDPRLVVLGVRVDNRTPWTPPLGGAPTRDDAAQASLVGTHLLLAARGTRFVSLLDGPSWAAADAASCAASRCWPGLIADEDGADAVLVSPIVLGDHPAIAPESPGDLFDATEIDEILTLRIRTLTEQEKADARGTDARAAAILDRCDTMTDDVLAGLHGARRPTATDDVLPVFAELDDDGELPWWDSRADARADPARDAVMVAGVPVSRGSRVLLRPSRRADAQDLFLAGATAVVARVYFDVDGGTHVAVALEDDPGRDLYDTTGRFYYFAPDEVEPLLTGDRRDRDGAR